MANAEDISVDFAAATDFVKDNSSAIGPDTLLNLYARFKQVKEGRCNTPKPGLFDLQGKQKWSAWKKLGDMNKECAMREYIDLVSEHSPGWQSQMSKSSDKASAGRQMSLGVAVSTMVNPDAVIDDELKTVFDWCKDGDTKHVARLIADNSINVDEKDSEGMVLLHWACDRGDTQMVSLLLKGGANVDIQDGEGQTGLHFAVICEHPDVVRLLLKNGARLNIPDTDGQTVQDLIPESTEEIQQILSSFPVR